MPRMTRDEIKWLAEPAIELRQYPNGTLLIVETKGQYRLCELYDNQPDAENWKFRRLPEFRVMEVEKALTFNSHFAIICQAPPA